VKPPLWRLPLAAGQDLVAASLFLAGVVLGPVLGVGLVKLACRVAGR